jgi:hypothetical protein
MFDGVKSKLQKRAVEATSLFVALCALFVTIYQARTTDYHNRLSLIPMLQFSIEYEEDKHASISIENVGTGPAIIKQFELAEKPFITLSDTLYDFAKLNNFDTKDLKAEALTIKSKLFLKAGQNIELLSVSLPKELKKEHYGYIEYLKILPITACYNSLYKDEFYVTTDQNYVGGESCANKGMYKVFDNWVKFKNPFGNEILQSEVFGK